MKNKHKGIIILGLEKPKNCIDCKFCRGEFIPADDIRKGLYKRLYNCELIPDYDGDGWHNFDWADQNVRDECPIRETSYDYEAMFKGSENEQNTEKH